MVYLFVLCFKLDALRFHSLNATDMEEFDNIYSIQIKRLLIRS